MKDLVEGFFEGLTAVGIAVLWLVCLIWFVKTVWSCV